MKPPLTVLEAQTLARLSLREDPWAGHYSDPNPVTQAIERLCRKSLIVPRGWAQYTVNTAGDTALYAMFEWMLRRGQALSS